MTRETRDETERGAGLLGWVTWASGIGDSWAVGSLDVIGALRDDEGERRLS